MYKDLAPDIYRQRLVIEGFPKYEINSDDIKKYLSMLSKTIDMNELLNPVTHLSEKYGWAGWIHWETSGAHLYAWESPIKFFSVDIYTCKKFNPLTAVNFTKNFFECSDISYKEF